MTHKEKAGNSEEFPPFKLFWHNAKNAGIIPKPASTSIPMQEPVLMPIFFTKNRDCGDRFMPAKIVGAKADNVMARRDLVLVAHYQEYETVYAA